jgi:hypothetical protein
MAWASGSPEGGRTSCLPPVTPDGLLPSFLRPDLALPPWLGTNEARPCAYESLFDARFYAVRTAQEGKCCFCCTK